jgi:putative endonuclease
MYYVYLLRNKKTGKLYIGYTDDIKRRIKEHKNKNPELIYCEVYKNKKDAIIRELKLKQRGQNVRWLKQRIKYSLEN